MTRFDDGLRLSGLLILFLAASSLQAAQIEGTVTIAREVPRQKERSGGSYGERAAPAVQTEQALEPLPELQNVVVFIKEAVPGRHELPKGPLLVKQLNARFIPRVLPVMVGGTVGFQNLDPFFHNVFSLSRAANFDLGKYPAPEIKERTFKSPGLVKLCCDIHSHMSGSILVLPHPFFAVPGPGGSYRITGIPPGQYTLVAWHDVLPPVMRKITIESGSEKLRSDFQF